VSDKEEFEYSDKLSAGEVGDYLVKLADGIRSRSLKLQGKGKAISLFPEEVVKLEVKGERKEGKGELEIEISWKEKYVVSAEKLEVSSGDLSAEKPESTPQTVKKPSTP
jgi:amphi-Trp domain-containing protein